MVICCHFPYFKYLIMGFCSGNIITFEVKNEYESAVLGLAPAPGAK